MPERQKDVVILRLRCTNNRYRIVGDFLTDKIAGLPSQKKTEAELESMCKLCPLFVRNKPRFLVIQSTLDRNHVIFCQGIPEKECKIKGVDIHFQVPR